MLRRFAPAISVLISLMLDTAILPRLYSGIYMIPLSLIVVIAIGILLGRMRGMLYGLLSGLLIDVSAGTLGMKTFSFVAIGFLIGFMLDQQDIFTKMLPRSERMRQGIVRAIWVFVIVLLYETAMLLLQYFSNAVFEWVYVRNLLLRVLMTVALHFILHPLFKRVYIGKFSSAATNRRTREVKNF